MNLNYYNIKAIMLRKLNTCFSSLYYIIFINIVGIAQIFFFNYKCLFNSPPVLASELESVRSLFNEKEKELVVAVGKVDELSDQLERMRSGRLAALRGSNQNSPAMLELERLRHELLVRMREMELLQICGD